MIFMKIVKSFLAVIKSIRVPWITAAHAGEISEKTAYLSVGSKVCFLPVAHPLKATIMG